MRRGSKLGSEHRRKFIAGGQRALLEHRNMIAKLSAGTDTVDGRGAQLDVSPAAWMPAQQHIGDCEFMDDGLDDVLLRAVHDRVVYAGSLTCHRSVPFEEIAARTMDAVVRGRVSNKGRKNGKADIESVPRPKPKSIVEHIKTTAPKLYAEMAKKPIPIKVDSDGYREGRSLTDVVTDLFKEVA